MAGYLLDTNTCIQLLTGRVPAVTQRFLQHDPLEIHLCSIVRAELEYGARHSRDVEENLQLLGRFCDPLTSLPFDDRCAEQYGLVREDLVRKGKLIGANDLLIAATALTHSLVLVTHNLKEFQRVAGLQLEDWESPE
ncbi:type II toxin-antitoxin system tRNA(fMet)-specific endonuclease VapC [Methylocaldum sp.]|uniref:type II toxin-antitoxin system tRNA(fMet)-specific endonuclease VapC n=1 Tax=Methylocaldum sp. TaxID=1969727 RepID=UPI002D3EFE69|nr:type II toxin-antitoxin system VapC family toxin [Methylocaldum sp.]HYE36212.1 type II toxin-antitoxin system VapC family toxin [Methylocaldum sp.]